MKILNPRSALLSDFEVLLILKEMEDEQQNAKSSTSDLSQANLEQGLAKVPENLRTVQYATMSTLCQPSRACLYQSADHLQNFHAALRKAGFIGGRRGAGSGKQRQVDYHEEEFAADEDEEAEEETKQSSSKSKKRRSTTSTARKSKRARQDAEDPAMRSPPPPALPSDSLDYNADERGPEEILPDRALTKAERLMLVNQVPRNLVELHTLVEELEMRFTESQVNELLNLVHTHLPLPLTDEEANDPDAQPPTAGEAEADVHYEDEDEDDAYNNGQAGQQGPVDWDTLEMNSKTQQQQHGEATNNGASDESMGQAADSTAPLFMGGDDDDDDEQIHAADEDEWVNEERGGDDDLAGPGGDDDD